MLITSKTMSDDLLQPFCLDDFISSKRNDLHFRNLNFIDAATRQNQYIKQTIAYLEYIQNWKPVDVESCSLNELQRLESLSKDNLAQIGFNQLEKAKKKLEGKMVDSSPSKDLIGRFQTIMKEFGEIDGPENKKTDSLNLVVQKMSELLKMGNQSKE